MCQYFPLYPVY